MADEKHSSATDQILRGDDAAKAAIGLVHTFEAQQIDPAETKALLRKIDLRLIPLICGTYALQSIDKTTLSYAAVFNVREDLDLRGSQFSWLGALFYLGYLAWEFPTNVLLQRLPINYFMSSTVIAWGAVLMCHAAGQDFAGLAAARTFLGAFEASINPGTMLLFSMYYTRAEQPFRMGIWIGSAGLGYVLAGISSFGIGHIKTGLDSWRWIFLIWGAVTVAWGIVILIWLPGAPLQAKFLTEHERALAITRVKADNTGQENKNFKWSQFKEAMLDLKTWLLFLFAVASNSPNGGLTNFQGLIIRGMGFSPLETTLIQMPSGAVQFLFCTSACYLATRFSNARIIIMIACLVPFLIGLLGLWLISNSMPWVRMAFFWISWSYTASWTLSMAIANANTAGYTKKITTNAMLLIGYCLGNFVGPFFFLTSQAPTYNLGVAMMLFCIGAQVLLLVGIWVLLWVRNKRNAKKLEEMGDDGLQGYERALLDETDLQNPHFKYVY